MCQRPKRRRGEETCGKVSRPCEEAEQGGGGFVFTHRDDVRTAQYNAVIQTIEWKNYWGWVQSEASTRSYCNLFDVSLSVIVKSARRRLWMSLEQKNTDGPILPPPAPELNHSLHSAIIIPPHFAYIMATDTIRLYTASNGILIVKRNMACDSLFQFEDWKRSTVHTVYMLCRSFPSCLNVN